MSIVTVGPTDSNTMMHTFKCSSCEAQAAFRFPKAERKSLQQPWGKAAHRRFRTVSWPVRSGNRAACLHGGHRTRSPGW